MKLLNVLLIAAIALTAFGIMHDRAQAEQTYTAYSVVNIQPDSGFITATVNVVVGRATAHRSAPIWSNGDVIRISTDGCEGTPKKGENGILVNGPIGRSLLTSGGATCKVTNIDLAEQH